MKQGEVMMTDCLESNASEVHKMLAHTHDKLGWDNFVEGRIGKFFLEVVAPMFPRRSRMTPEHWRQRLVSLLMQAIHKQWIFRKSHVNHKKLDGLTEEQHLLIFRKVEESMLTDPSDLLTQHRMLLEGGFTELGEGPIVYRQC